ncbi:putative Myosin-2 heavy chain, non muscle [Cardiosporidium cionae]|uniref:Myosin-2 heavy chain, non muscle n=1 Tax=Cardiosporidium cionae TaxID=476202 RepID=A0ABQ7J626_9APIC|nr:putative Myosin-2 heavy chain, non muscle [Cardiosporidium cionae]|eukprot:KAF8819437.1 putative Myosin-2 heavy chain, non muscle [Cardiosporidium cionae]
MKPTREDWLASKRMAYMNKKLSSERDPKSKLLPMQQTCTSASSTQDRPRLYDMQSIRPETVRATSNHEYGRLFDSASHTSFNASTPFEIPEKDISLKEKEFCISKGDAFPTGRSLEQQLMLLNMERDNIESQLARYPQGSYDEQKVLMLPTGRSLAERKQKERLETELENATQNIGKLRFAIRTNKKSTVG